MIVLTNPGQGYAGESENSKKHFKFQLGHFVDWILKSIPKMNHK